MNDIIGMLRPHTLRTILQDLEEHAADEHIDTETRVAAFKAAIEIKETLNDLEGPREANVA